jgi:hypothetical protein
MLTRNWYWILAALVVIGIGSFQILRPKEPLETIKIYKTVTPAPKPSPVQTNADATASPAVHGHNHDYPHPHGTASHSHDIELTTTSSAYDWRDDSGFDLPFAQNDPWAGIYPGGEPTDDADDTYPPRDWHKTEDPALWIEYLQAQLIKQFGDIPEVHTFVVFREKGKLGIPIKDADEYLTFLRAQYTLWPMEETLKTLENLENRMAEGVNIVFGPVESP